MVFRWLARPRVQECWAQPEHTSLSSNYQQHGSRLLTITSGVHIAEAAVVCHVQLVAVPRVAAEARRAAAEAQHRRAVYRVLVDAKEEVT